MANAIDNHDFSTNVAGWAATGSGTNTVTHSPTVGHDALGSMRVQTDGTAAGQGAGQLAEGLKPFAQGDTVEGSVWARGAGTVFVGVVERYGPYPQTAGTEHPGTPLTLTDAWQLVRTVATLASASTTSASIRIKTSSAQAVTFWVDDAYLGPPRVVGYVETIPATGTNASAPVIELA